MSRGAALAGLGLALLVACRSERPIEGPSPAARTSAPPARLALLVGVGAYADPGVPAVPGATRDIALMGGLLRDHYGFPADDIMTLQGEQATADGIRRAFRTHLIERAGPGTVAVFHFSGHGRQVWDRSGDEPDEWDEALAAYDTAATPGGTGDAVGLLDDEIGAWVDALRATGAEVTVIVDACHSGSPTRDGIAGRSAPPVGAIRGGADTTQSTGGLLDAADAPGATAAGGLVVVSAALSHQLAKDAVDPDGHAYGAFTWALARTLGDAPPGTTWRAAIEPIRHRVAGVVCDQTPQVEGQIDRAVFGVTDHRPPPGTLPIVEDGAGLALAGGALHGVIEGAIWSIDGPEGPVGRAPVIAVGPTTARLGPLSAAAKTPGYGDGPMPLPLGARAREWSRPLRAAPPTLGFDGPPALAAALGNVGIEARRAPAPITLRVDGDRARFEWLDRRILGAPIAAEPEIVIYAAWHWTRWLRLVELDGGAPDKARLELRGGRITPDGARWVRPGDHVQLVVSNLDQRAVWYANLLDLSEDGTVTRLWPPAGVDGALAPDRAMTVPPGDGGLTITLPDGRGTTVDVLKLLLTRRPVDFSPLVRGAADAEGHALVRWLSATRGGAEGTLERDDWAVETLWVWTCPDQACPR